MSAPLAAKLPAKTSLRLSLNKALRKAGIHGDTWALIEHAENGAFTLTIQPGGDGAACCELVFSETGAIQSASIFDAAGNDL